MVFNVDGVVELTLSVLELGNLMQEGVRDFQLGFRLVAKVMG